MENSSTDSRQSWPRPQPFPRRAANGLLTHPQRSAGVAQDFYNAVSRPLSSLAGDCEEAAKRLEATGDYKVLRRLVPTQATLPAIVGDKIGVIVDFETTGLNYETDEIIEVAMLKFRYSGRDEITGVSGTFQSFNKPATTIPPDVVELTGINDEMVKGCRIDAGALEAFVSDANIVIAHNASFDRKFAEHSWDIFRRRHWACSSSGIDWRKFGFFGTKLVYLLSQCGLFHGAHRALDDCHATLQILARPLPNVDKTALAVLLENARRKTFRIWAEGAPFDLKEILRRRGYRWNNGTGGRPRAWYIDLEEIALTTEQDFLRNEIYGHDLNLECTEITSLDRYSGRV
jgi:DNA polymerase-3 subunit epsilon